MQFLFLKVSIFTYVQLNIRKKLPSSKRSQQGQPEELFDSPTCSTPRVKFKERISNIRGKA